MRAAESWTAGVIGVWILLAPWLLGFADIGLAKWSNVICGLALILSSMWTVLGGATLPSEGQKGRQEQKNITYK